MKGNEFIRKIKKLGRKNNVVVKLAMRRGRGSHGSLFYGERFTIIRDAKDELKTGTLHAMLDQLGLKLEYFLDS